MTGGTDSAEGNSFPEAYGESKHESLSLQEQAAEANTDLSSDQFQPVEIGRGPLSPNGRLQQNIPTSQTGLVPSMQHQAASLNANQAIFMVPMATPFQQIVANPYAMALQNAIQSLAMVSAAGAQQQTHQLGNMQPAVLAPSMQQAASTLLASMMMPASATTTIPVLQGLPTAAAQVMAQTVAHNGLLQMQQQQQREAAMACFSGQQQQAGIHDGASTMLPSSAPASADVRNEGLTRRSAVPLYLDYDEQALSEYQCLLRKQIELFETRPEDIQGNAQGRNTPIYIGQVGIRCRHCSVLPKAVRPMGTVYYSRTLAGVYQVAQNMAKVHYFGNKCNQMPTATKQQLEALQRTNKRASGGKEYWIDGLKVHGVYEDGKALRFRPLESGSRGF